MTTTTHTPTPKPEHFAAMAKMHTTAAQFFAAEIAKLSDRQLHGPKHKKLRAGQYGKGQGQARFDRTWRRHGDNAFWRGGIESFDEVIAARKK